MNALGRVRAADAQATYARRELRRMMRDEIESGRATQADIARAFGLSRQRVRQMLNHSD
jgi:DNA-directed RNA polymerase sigma subunit (sigma70/sigma32)